MTDKNRLRKSFGHEINIKIAIKNVLKACYQIRNNCFNP